MNENVNKFLLAGDKSMSEMHLRQPGFTYSACGPFTKNKEKIKIYADRKYRVLFRKMILIKLVFSMVWLMVNQKI